MLFHRHLDGEGPQPFEHFIGRLCEEFQCLPTQAWREWLRLPAGFMAQIIEYRGYRNAKQSYDAATTPEARRALRGDELVDLVEQHTFALVAAARATVPRG